MSTDHQTNPPNDPLAFAHPCTRDWFSAAFDRPTPAQTQGWPAIVSGEHTLLLAPTGSGKTLAAFMVAIDRLAFQPRDGQPGVKVLYISPLKALGVDIERNLRAPLAGIRAVAKRSEQAVQPIRVAVRSGDTPQNERQRMARRPPDILITTPESLYLILTSRAAEMLTRVETVIVDEIHSVVPSKRGLHLALSLERLERLRIAAGATAPAQRIGLSATQRPLDEIARFLGGHQPRNGKRRPKARPVCIVDAGHEKAFDLLVEVPVEDMTQLGQVPETDDGEATTTSSIWPSIHPRLVELIRAHRSTMIFCNSRRLAERLSGAINELAGEELALAHHGSIAKDLRGNIEDRLKRGDLPAIVATSSLELGIDIGAVDLVIQIEAPPSVASGIQRIGRAGHQVGAVSRGIIFPKFRGDLLACAAVTQHILDGQVEATHYPRNALDVLAQQIVAMSVAHGPGLGVDALFDTIRQAAPYAELPRRSFDGLLDMLSGRYPSEEFGELRPRITWDRIADTIQPRRGARMLAVANSGTIPDRGLYGVFLASSEKPIRVGELDEEMVFESREGDVFLLGASSWRIEEITHDQVMVTPAPGEPGRMPFWHGDRLGRPVDFGRAIGKLTGELVDCPRGEAIARLTGLHGLDELAANNLVQYLADQRAATNRVPTDRVLVLERFMDEVGDWCVTVLSPFGARVHSPWATAVGTTLLRDYGISADTMWSDDGIVFRIPDTDDLPPDEAFFPDADEVEDLITARLVETALFASHFRENAGRALLLPKRRPGERAPLWALRRKSAALLTVAAQFSDFPIILETYRECLKDVFDLPALVEILRGVQSRKLRVESVQTARPSPFAASLMFNYVASYMYEGDAPLAERRASALSLDQEQLRELLGEAELRELLDADAVEELEQRLQRFNGRWIKHPDHVHDLLLALGDQSLAELAARTEDLALLESWLDDLVAERRVLRAGIADEQRFIAAEEAGRYRDALGVVPPQGTPFAFLEPVERPLRALVGRYARTHGPFRSEDVAKRFGLGVGPVRAALEQLAEADQLLEGEFLPRSVLARRGIPPGREWCHSEVLRQIKRVSLAKLRKQIAPVEPEALARLLLDWQGVGSQRRGLDALVTAVEQLQGHPIPASVLESQVLACRLQDFDRRDLDTLCAAGEVLWRGVQPLGQRDGRVALFLADHYALLAPPVEPAEGALQAQLRELLRERGALFFRDMLGATQRPATELFEALWDLVWAGEVTNDTLTPVRSLVEGTKRGQGGRVRGARSIARLNRRAAVTGPPGSEGRWSLLPKPDATPTERMSAWAAQLLERNGVLTREAVAAGGLPGGFSAVYPVLKAMEEAGRTRRGYFVAGLGATQFALPGCEDRLRDQREAKHLDGPVAAVVLSADDPANPYGAALPWPQSPAGWRAQRAAGCQVILWDGWLIGFLDKKGERLLTFLPEDEPARGHASQALVGAVARGVGRPRGRGGGAGVLITEINGQPVRESHLASAFEAGGFGRVAKGYFRRVDPAGAG